MRNILNWMQRNILAVVLIVVVIGFIVYTILSQSSNRVVSAEDASTMIVQPVAPVPGGNATGISTPIPVGTTTFCLRLDGRENGHLPALMGSAAQNAYANGINGSNWSLPATATGNEPYGIMSDGIVFAKVTFLKQYGMVSFCEIKCDQTGWIAEQMTPATIGGESALVFQLK